MKISELKETVRTVIIERSINAIAKLQQKNIEDISKALEFYKKNKHTDKKEAFIKVLKKLGNEKLKLAGELDLKVSGMYKDAEYKGEGIEEGENGLWDNIRKKKARGGKPAHKNSKAHKDAVKAGDKIKANESVNERNITRSTERVLQKGIQSILGTSVNQEMNDNGAYEFFVDYAEFVIGVGEDETKKAKYAFSIYDDGARKYLAKGKSNDEKDLIKQILSSVKKFKNKLLLTTESVNEASIKGKNNKTGEAFGMVIGSDKTNRDGEFEVTVRITYSSRISSYKFMFDKGSNLIAIKDYGYSMDGKFPDMKGGGSVKSVKPNPRETITQIAKVTSPAFAKKIYQHVQKALKSIGEGVVNEMSMGFDNMTGLFYLQGVPFTKERIKEVILFMKKAQVKSKVNQFEYTPALIVKDKVGNNKVVIDSKNYEILLLAFKKNSAKLASDKDF